MGVTKATTLAGTPSNAAGINKKVNKLINTEIDCLKAQAKSNSSLL